MSGQKKNGLTLQQKHGLTGWVFLAPAVLLICWTSFYPMIRAFISYSKRIVGAMHNTEQDKKNPTAQ